MTTGVPDENPTSLAGIANIHCKLRLSRAHPKSNFVLVSEESKTKFHFNRSLTRTYNNDEFKQSIDKRLFVTGTLIQFGKKSRQ